MRDALREQPRRGLASRSLTLRRRVVRIRRAVAHNFRQRVIYPWELPSIMRKHIYTGAMGSLYFALVSGIFFVYYGGAVGMSRFQWGLMASLSSLALVAQLVSALVTQRMGRRKLLWFVSALAGRTIRLAAILTALVLWRSGSTLAPVALIAGIVLANLCSAVGVPPWMSWLADLIPEREHGGFWGRRDAWIALATALALVPAAILLDVIPDAWKVYAAVAVFAVATVVGILDLVIHGTLPEPEMALPEREHPLVHLLAPLRDRGFRPWLLFNAAWTFSMTLGGALATVFFIEELGLGKNLVGGTIVLTVFSLVGGMLTASWTGRLVDRVGPKRVMFGGHLLWALLPGFWLIATPGTALVWLGVASLVSGTASRAAVTAANKLITRFPPAEERAMYIAVSSCLGSLAGGIGAFVAGAVLRSFATEVVQVAGLALGGFQVLFIASMVLRLASAAVLIPLIRDPEAAPGPQAPGDASEKKC